MSDASDAVAEALARTKRMAAGRQVRKDEIEAELARRKRDRASLAELPSSPEVDALGSELDARIAALATELAAVESDLAAATRELSDLRKLGRDAERNAAMAVVRGATGDDDEVLRSDEDVALDNVRGHLKDLEAGAKVKQELDEIERPSTPPTTKKTF